MIGFAAPGFLLAGALLALVPLALHMLARTPPERRPLPTARFLTVDPRTRLRLRRPGDLLLLALRMAFLVLLGAAFADPEWLPERSGQAVIVMLDAGSDMTPIWEQAVAVARDRLGDDGTLVVFDTTALTASDPGAALDSLGPAGPGEAPASYLSALRGLRAAAGGLHAESASAVLITRPRWGAWSRGVAMARGAAWPARIEVIALTAPAAAPPGDEPERSATAATPTGDEPERGAALVVGPETDPLQPYATAALEALGYSPASEGPADLVVVLPGAERAGTGTPAGAAGTARVVLGGAVDRADGPRPWTGIDTASPGPRRSRGRLVLGGGRTLEGWVPLSGRPTEAAMVVAVWEDGTPAAAVARDGTGCTAYLAAEPVTPGTAADPGYPWLLRALADGCRPEQTLDPLRGHPHGGNPLDPVPLDRGALEVLAGDGRPAAAGLHGLDGSRGLSLARLLAALALLIALAETALAYGRRRGS